MSVLSELSDAEFEDELNECLFIDEAWATLLEPDICRRTLAATLKLRADIDSQVMSLSKPKRGSSDAEYMRYRHARGFLIKVQVRQSEVAGIVKAINRKESASVEANQRKWGMFTQQLAESLAKSDMSHVLDELCIDGDLTAAQWLGLRKQQQSSKQ